MVKIMELKLELLHQSWSADMAPSDEEVITQTDIYFEYSWKYMSKNQKTYQK